MSTIYGLMDDVELSIHDFKKMENAMVSRISLDNEILIQDHLMISSTKISKTENEVIAFCGRIRNLDEVKTTFKLGHMDEIELFKYFYMQDKQNAVQCFDGHFVFMIASQEGLTIYRDALGVEPFYYCFQNDRFIFASELKGILAFRNQNKLSEDGLMQLLGILPGLCLDKTPFEDIYILRPGHYLEIKNHQLETKKWWYLNYQENTQSKEEIKKEIYHLVSQSISQDTKDIDYACLLSGGLDSSLICANLASHTQKTIPCFSVDYEEQEKYFKSYSYQTTRDNDFILEMTKRYPQLHQQTITLSQQQLSSRLNQVLKLRDLPGMVDIDSSLDLFIEQIGKEHSVVLSGECADEIFGGYPWFYREDLFQSPYFPWTTNLDERLSLIKKNLLKADLKKYIKEKKEATLKELDLSLYPTSEHHKLQMMYLTMNWFMQTLLTRGDVIGASHHVDIRMPFASKPLVEYLWNVPWDILYQDGKEKAILREAFKNELPASIYNRKKNPYPKTHSPVYATIVLEKLDKVLKNKKSFLYEIFDANALKKLLKSKGEAFSLPWYGQLMTGPQLLAYLYTIDYWAKQYHIELKK